MRTVRHEVLTGLVAQSAVLALLAGSVGLAWLGWLVGLGCGAAAGGWLGGALARSGGRAGPADWVTLVRATLVGGVTALVADSVDRPAPVPALVGLAVVALALDAVDGRVARRTGTVSAVGARFDMEVDAFLILVLSVFVARSVGPWVLVIGAARYLLALAGLVWPWLRRPTPPRYWAKVVAAVQGSALVTVAAGVLPHSAEEVVLVVAMALLAESFGREVAWLARHRPTAGSAVGSRSPQSAHV